MKKPKLESISATALAIASLFLIMNLYFNGLANNCEMDRNESLFLQQHYWIAQNNMTGVIMISAIFDKSSDEINSWILESAESTRQKILNIIENNECKIWDYWAISFLIAAFILTGSAFVVLLLIIKKLK